MSSLDEGSACCRDSHLTTQNNQLRQTSCIPGGIQTHNPKRRAAADLRLRPRGHQDRPRTMFCALYILFCLTFFYCHPLSATSKCGLFQMTLTKQNITWNFPLNHAYNFLTFFSFLWHSITNINNHQCRHHIYIFTHYFSVIYFDTISFTTWFLNISLFN
jgi:hypothetical protein